MAEVGSRLTELQADLLEAFFRHEDRFYLTGGGALAGYHLGQFRRVLLSRGDDSVIVDLAIEHTEQVRPEKPARGSVRVDPAEEKSLRPRCVGIWTVSSRDLPGSLTRRRPHAVTTPSP